MSDPQQPIEELGFEEAMQALDSLVSSLESGQLPLEDMVNAYERGMSLLRVCRARIDSARRRVEAINLNLEGKTQATLTEFAPLESLISAAETSTSNTSSASQAKRPSSNSTNKNRDRDKDKDKDSGTKSSDEDIRLI